MSARERAGRVWVADGAIGCPRPLVKVASALCGNLEEMGFELQEALNRKDASYDNVKAFTELISQGLFLSRRSVKNNQRAIEQRKRRFKPV